MIKNAAEISISHLNNTIHFKIFALQVKLFNEHFFDLEHGRKTCIDIIFCADFRKAIKVGTYGLVYIYLSFHLGSRPSGRLSVCPSVRDAIVRGFFHVKIKPFSPKLR